MPLRLDRADADFEARFAAFLATKREVSEDVDAVVRDIIARIRAEGDAALIDYTARFDRLDLTAAGIRIGEAEIDAALDAVDADTLAALEFAHERIASHHARQMPQDDRYTDAAGIELGSRWSAIEAVGLYVPGGTASYPSSVLMNAVPAKVAGVERIVITVPAPPRSTASAARRRSRRSPMARKPSLRSPRSSGRATPSSPPPSAASSARSAST
jgi:histidinol dehydrogenase